jgi:hypothetical protein
MRRCGLEAASDRPSVIWNYFMIETPSGIVGGGKYATKNQMLYFPADIGFPSTTSRFGSRQMGDDPHEDHNIGEMYNWVFGSRC